MGNFPGIKEDAHMHVRVPHADPDDVVEGGGAASSGMSASEYDDMEAYSDSVAYSRNSRNRRASAAAAVGERVTSVSDTGQPPSRARSRRSRPPSRNVMPKPTKRGGGVGDGSPRQAPSAKRAAAKQKTAEEDDGANIVQRLHELRITLNDHSPDNWYLTYIANVIRCASSHFRSMMDVALNLDELRKTHRMTFVGYLVHAIESRVQGMSSGHDDDDDDDAPNPKDIGALMSHYCNLSSTVVTIDRCVSSLVKARNAGRRRRYYNAPSFLDTMLCLRDVFMVGCVGDFIARGHTEHAAGLQHAFAMAVCDDAYLKAAACAQPKDYGKRMRMNGHEYAYAGIAAHAKERFETLMRRVGRDDDARPLFSVVVPKRVLRNNAPKDSDGADKRRHNSTTFDARDRFQCRRMLTMHYLRRDDDEFSSENATHVVMPVDAVLYAQLKRAGEREAVTNTRMGELIAENARCVSEIMDTCGVCSRRMVRNYLRSVAPHVFQNRIGDEVVTRRGGATTVKVVGVDAYGPYPPGRTHGRSEANAVCVGNLALAEALCGQTREYACADTVTPPVKHNDACKLIGHAAQGPTLYNAVEMAVTCSDARVAESLVERAAMIAYCRQLPPVRNVYVLSQHVALAPSLSNIKRAIDTNDRSSTFPFMLSLKYAWFPSVTAFVAANMRFVPMFDITLWVRYGDSMSFSCIDVRVDMFAEAPSFLHGSIGYSADGNDLVVRFDMSVDEVRRNIMPMSTASSIKRNRNTVPPADAEVYFPVHWRSPDVKEFAQRELDAAYGNQRVQHVDLRQASVYSFVQSQSVPTCTVLMGTDMAPRLGVLSPNAARPAAQQRALPKSASRATHPCSLRGYRVSTDLASANEASDVKWRASERYRMIDAVMSGKAEEQHNVSEVAMCGARDALLSASVHDTFCEPRTNVECARSITVEMRLPRVDAQTLMHDILSVYGFWPANANAYVESLHMPKFDQYTLRKYAEQQRAQRRGGAPPKRARRVRK